MDDRCEGNEANAVRKRCILEARRRGEVIIACCHLNNPLTGGDSWDNSSAEVVRGILEDGSAVQAKFKTWLDRLATFAGELKDDQGKPIPVIFRPFHEHTQTWSWWGKVALRRRSLSVFGSLQSIISVIQRYTPVCLCHFPADGFREA